jgi:hypothetical protein
MGRDVVGIDFDPNSIDHAHDRVGGLFLDVDAPPGTSMGAAS